MEPAIGAPALTGQPERRSSEEFPRSSFRRGRVAKNSFQFQEFFEPGFSPFPSVARLFVPAKTGAKSTLAPLMFTLPARIRFATRGAARHSQSHRNINYKLKSLNNAVTTVSELSRLADVTGDFCTRWNERESTWRKSWPCRSRGTNQSRS